MKSNMLTSNDFMHNVKDYVLPIIVLIIIIVLLIFFKRTCIKSAIHNLGGSKTIKSSRNIEHFNGKVNLGTLNTKIHGNLFSGFESRKESDKQLDKVKDIIANNPEKYKMISPYRNNIFINGNESNKLQKICLGNVEDNCIDYDLMKKYDPATNPIPIFVKGTSEDPVYYNHDDTVVKHDKLCIRDDEKGTPLVVNDATDISIVGNDENTNLYSCIEDKHLNIINGSIAIAFKKQPPDVTSVNKEVDIRKSQTTADGKEGCLGKGKRLKDKYAVDGCKDDTTGRLDLKCPFPANWNCGPSDSDLSIILYGRTKKRGKEIKVYNWEFNGEGIFTCPKSCDRIRSYIIMETGRRFDVENSAKPDTWSKLESSMDDTTSNKDYAKNFRNDFRILRRCKPTDDVEENCAEVSAEDLRDDCKADGDDEIIKSYNVEYGPFKGFGNVATKTFYMTEKNYNEIECKFNNLSFDQAAPGCFSSDQGGRTKHYIAEPRGEAFTYSGNYYINQQTPDISNYKHIHKHEDS